MSLLQIAGFEKESIVDGPGIRFVVFTQGCHHNCKGCHNPETHDLSGGTKMKIDDILIEVDRNPLLDGITISGGEPLLQMKEVGMLLKEAKERDLSTLLYTGYLYEDICETSETDKELESLLKYLDYMIDGPFIEAEKDLLLRFRGSKNQRIIDVINSTKDKIKEIEL